MFKGWLRVQTSSMDNPKSGRSEKCSADRASKSVSAHRCRPATASDAPTSKIATNSLVPLSSSSGSADASVWSELSGLTLSEVQSSPPSESPEGEERPRGGPLGAYGARRVR